MNSKNGPAERKAAPVPVSRKQARYDAAKARQQAAFARADARHAAGRRPA